MSLTVHPLFRRASKAIAVTAHKEWRRSTLGQLTAEAERSARMGSMTGRRLQSLIDRYTKASPRQVASQLLGGDLGQIRGMIERYSMKSATRTFLHELFGQLGPIGGVIRSLIEPGPRGRRRGLDRDLQTASDFLRAFGRGVFSSEEAMIEHLRGRGYKITRPGQPEPSEIALAETSRKSKLPFGISEDTASGKPRKVVDMTLPGGTKRRFKVDHPIVTGAMVPTPNSTNVYSFSYNIESSNLFVRYRQAADVVAKVYGEKGHRTRGLNNVPGSLYQYYEIKPEEYLKLYQARNGGGRSGGDKSPGTWVWSHLRTRGTISGTLKPYRLVGISLNYVPRKATLRPDGEWYTQRNVRLGGRQRGSWLKSSRPDRLVRGLMPNRGTPNNGAPSAVNRGTPNRGK